MRSRSRTKARIRSCSSRAEVEQLIRPGMVDRDRVEHTARERVRVVRHRLLADPVGPQPAGEAQHLGPDLVVRRGGARLELLGRDRRLEGVVELAVVELGTQAEVAVRGRQQLVPQPGGEGLDRRDRRLRCRVHPVPRRFVDVAGHLDCRPAQVRHSGHGGDRLLHVEGSDRAAASRGEVGARRIEHRGDALHAAGHARQSLLDGGVLAGKEPEEPPTEEVDVDDRAPRCLVELLLVEDELVDRGEQDAPIDLVLARQPVGGREPVTYLPEPCEPPRGP